MAKTAPKKAPEANTPIAQAAPAPEAETDPSGELLERVGISADAPDFAADEAELGGEQSNYRWHLSRSTYVNGKRAWETCNSYPAGAGVLTADLIRDDWGPGTYYAQLRPAPGSGVGHGGVKKTRTFTLAAPRAATATPGATSSTETLLQKMIETQQSGFIRLGELLAARPPAAGADPAAMLDLAMRMAERMAPKRSDGFDFDGVGRLLEFADKVRGGKGWPDLVSEGIETVKPLVELAVSRLGGEHPTPTPNGAPAPHVNGSQPKIEGPLMWQIQLANFLKRQAPYLIGKAKAKASANLYAEVLIDNLPEAVTFEQLHGLLKQPNALQRVFDQMPPDLKAQAEGERAWFEELVRELVGFLEAQLGIVPPGDSAEPAGDTPAA